METFMGPQVSLNVVTGVYRGKGWFRVYRAYVGSRVKRVEKNMHTADIPPFPQHIWVRSRMFDWVGLGRIKYFPSLVT